VRFWKCSGVLWMARPLRRSVLTMPACRKALSIS